LQFLSLVCYISIVPTPYGCGLKGSNNKSIKQMNTVTLPVKGLNFAGCAREIEKHLGKLEPIQQVEASYVSQTVTIVYDETKLSEAQLREMVKDCGFACGAPLTRFAGPNATVSQGIEAARAHRTMVHPAMEHRGEASVPAKMDMGIVDHSMMGHDMSDPAMAREMEADMRNRFFVSLVLTIPVILYSPPGVNLFKLHLPTPFGISPNWVLLILTTPVVWWGGWIFHYGARRALRNRTLDMNVLVSLGVLVAYFFSAFVTFVAPHIETSSVVPSTAQVRCVSGQPRLAVIQTWPKLCNWCRRRRTPKLPPSAWPTGRQNG
jgi:Cu2+-exporting ATPase